MELIDEHISNQILGCLIKNPLLLIEYPDLVANDFGPTKIKKLCFKAITNLVKQGAKSLSIIDIENEILKTNGAGAQLYNQEKGLEMLKACNEIAQPENFIIYYTRFKKLALLRALKNAHYDISEYYKDATQIDNPLEEIKLQTHLDESTLEDILNNVESKYNSIRNEFLQGGKKNGRAGDGIFELIDSLHNAPDNGPMLEGDYFSLVSRGARLGKFYIRSASSGGGKTRGAVFDACRLCYPVRYNHSAETFVREVDSEWQPVAPRKILFIVTEMDKEELQTIILAYLSGVNEEHILRNRYDFNEEQRVMFAAHIMEKYKEYFLIEEISEPDLLNVEATIKKYVTINKVKYIFYDYIHSTAGLIGQFARTGLREDVCLMLLSNQLKQLAKDYNVFIYSATQLNAAGMENTGEFKDMTSIRGAKSISDKIDLGYIVTKITPQIWNNVVGTLRKNVDKSTSWLDNENERPTHILDVYKNRRGRMKDIRIWTKMDLGTGYRKDLMITNMNNFPLEIPDDTIFSTRVLTIENWQLLMKG